MVSSVDRLFDQVVGPLVTGEADVREVIAFMMRLGLLAPRQTCPGCQGSMKLTRLGRSQDGWTWSCTSGHTARRVSVRTGSWYADSKVTLKKCLHLTYLWAEGNILAKTAARICGISRNVVGRLWGKVRSMLQEWLTKHPYPKLGAPGGIVEADESSFRHKRRYH